MTSSRMGPTELFVGRTGHDGAGYHIVPWFNLIFHFHQSQRSLGQTVYARTLAIAHVNPANSLAIAVFATFAFLPRPVICL